MNLSEFSIRNASPDEFHYIGALMVKMYSALEGFPKPDEHPKYFEMLANVGEQTNKPETELLVAVTADNQIAGAVVYFGDMMYYGSKGTATLEKNASGFRFLAVDNKYQGKGIGKALTLICLDKARNQQKKQLIIHTTKAMQPAWNMYEIIGFKRSEDLDFTHDNLDVFGFRFIF